VADRKQHDWSQLAEAPIIEQPSSALWSPRNSYSVARTWGLSSDSTEQVGTTYSVASLWGRESLNFVEDRTQLDAYSGTANTETKEISLDVDDTQLDTYSDALSWVMEDDSGYNTQLSA